MSIVRGNTRLLAIIIFAVSFVGGALLLFQFGFEQRQIWLDASVNAVILTFTVWLGVTAVKTYPTKVGVVIYGCLIGLFAGLLAWYLSKLALNALFHDDAGYLIWLQRTRVTRLIMSVLVNCWLITLSATNQRCQELEARFKQLTDAASLHREAELFKLRQQLQPHFLYNSLNSISALIMIQPDKAQEMIGKLSDFLRNSVKREAREQIPVVEELEYIEAYLAIEAVRFGDRLQVVYQKSYTDHAVIPPFLLQPLLENAIKFGLYGKTGSVSIQLHIALQDAFLVITIANPYDPGNRPPSGTGFGLEGIRRRLYLLYGRTDLLDTQHTDTTFITILKIPQANVQGDTH